VAFFKQIYFLNNVIASFEHKSSSLEESQTSHTNTIAAEESQETQMPSFSDSASFEEHPTVQSVQQCRQAILRKATKATAGSRDHYKIQ
jgi:hypothetical protein